MSLIPYTSRHGNKQTPYSLRPLAPLPSTEIPLFHVVAAKVTFGNLDGGDSPVPHVQVTSVEGDSQTHTPSHSQMEDRYPMSVMGQEGLKRRHGGVGEEASGVPNSMGVSEVTEGGGTSSTKEKCIISDACFAVPEGYRGLNRGRAQPYDDDELLQLAIEQSLLEQGPTVEEFLYESAQVMQIHNGTSACSHTGGGGHKQFTVVYIVSMSSQRMKAG